MYNYHLFAQEDRRVELLQKNEDEQQRYKELKASNSASTQKRKGK